MELGVAELEPWLLREFGARESEAVKDILKSCAGIEAGLKDVKSALDVLAKASFSGDAVMDARVNMIKDGFVTKARSGLSGIPAPGKGYRDFTRFLEKSRAAVNVAAAATPKQGYVLSTYFKPEGRAFFAAFQKASAGIESLGSKLAGEYAFLGGMEQVREDAGSMVSTQRQLKFLGKKCEDAALKVKEAESGLKNETGRLTALRKGGEWRALEDRKRSLEKLRKEAESLRSRLSSEAASLSRLMKKLGHDTGDRDAEEFTGNPHGAVMSFGRQRLASLLGRADEAVRKGVVKTKGSERKRLEGFAKNLPAVAEAAAMAAALQKELVSAEAALKSAPVAAEEIALRASIEATERRLAELRSEERAMQAECAKVTDAAEARRGSVEESLAAQGRKVKLRI